MPSGLDAPPELSGGALRTSGGVPQKRALELPFGPSRFAPRARTHPPAEVLTLSRNHCLRCCRPSLSLSPSPSPSPLLTKLPGEAGGEREREGEKREREGHLPGEVVPWAVDQGLFFFFFITLEPSVE